MRSGRPYKLTLEELAVIPQGVIGGLIVELADPARTGKYMKRWERDLDLWRAVYDGLHAAVRGRQPQTQVERLPSWLQAALWVRLRNHETYWLGEDFVIIRTLELLGLAVLEPDDDYVMSMLTGLVSAWSWDENIWGDPVAWFRRDPGLIDRSYWRAYEIEGIGVVSLRVDTGATDWRTATQQMIREGMITRQQVITACLAALDRDFSPAASQWFVLLLRDLELNDDELAAIQPAIRRQLSHQAAVVVTTALSWLKRLDQQSRLDDEATAPALEAALLAPTKVTALAGLRLLSNIRARTPAADVTSAARAGLGHRHTDVQRAAARLLVAAGAPADLAADADLLEPSIRQEFGLRPIPDETALRNGDLETALESTPWEGRRPRVTPNDVTERLAVLLEKADDPHELELVLDRLAQTGKTDLLRPLAKRAQTILAANSVHRLEEQLAALVLASTGSPISPSHPPVPWVGFLHRRLTDVKQILAGTRTPGPLLATPTAPTGWLDPVELVQRLRHTDLETRRADLLAAMLRLTPDNRPDALRLWGKAAAAVPPEIDQAIRHALGAEQELAYLVSDQALWVAASRARAALRNDQLLIDNGLAGAGQGRGLDSTVSVVANPRWRASHGDPDDRYHLHLNHAHPCPPAEDHATSRGSWRTEKKRGYADQPTATGNITSGADWNSLDWVDTTWLSWHSLIWTADAEHYASAVLLPTFFSRLWTTSDTSILDSLTALRRHPGRFGPTSTATIALAMTGGTVQTRVHAADTVVNLITRQRTSTDDLAAALLTTAPAATPARWANTLQHVAAAGHADITIRLLTRVLPGLPHDRRGLHAVVDLLHQELLRTGGDVSDPDLSTYLAQFTGGSKVARSAHAILALGRDKPHRSGG